MNFFSNGISHDFYARIKPVSGHEVCFFGAGTLHKKFQFWLNYLFKAVEQSWKHKYFVQSAVKSRPLLSGVEKVCTYHELYCAVILKKCFIFLHRLNVICGLFLH